MDSAHKGSRDNVYHLAQKLDTEISTSIQEGQKHEIVITPPEDEDACANDSFDDESDDNAGSNLNVVSRMIVFVQKIVHASYMVIQKWTRGYFLLLVYLGAYITYFVTAMCYKFGDEGSYRLLACTVLAIVLKLRHKFYAVCKMIAGRLYGDSVLTPKDKLMLSKVRFFSRWISYGCLAAVVAWMLIEEGLEKPENLRSLPGLLLFNVIPVVFSTRPSKINWHVIYWSNGLQFLCAIVVLKWRLGRDSILWLQELFDNFFAHSKVASSFLFGSSYTDHQLVFNSAPLLLFSGATLATLYYLGFMQFIINAIGSLFRFALNTSLVESTSVSLGIFTEGTTTLMTIRPFLMTLTKSQMFTVVTSCFTSLGGAYIAILASMGVSLEYIIPAMLVSAPACFTVCKIIIPETKSEADEYNNEGHSDIFVQEKKRYRNLLEAFQTGALSSISVAVNTVVICFVFMCLITWTNSTLTWFGERVGIDNMSVELISSYLLYPVSLAMGVETMDCRRVALLLGYRIGFNNIIAFFKLGEMKNNKHQFMTYMMTTNGTGSVSRDGMDFRLDLWNITLPYGFLTDRSEAILTYCLCGFSSILSVGITMSILCAMVPQRKLWLSKITIPALIAANIANCMTGCFASIFY